MQVADCTGLTSDNCINYSTRGMWKISFFRLEEVAVEVAIFTLSRPVTA